MLFRGFNNLFKMCQSTARRQVVENNFRKSQMRQLKAARERESRVTEPRGPEDTDSAATAYSNPCLAYIPEDEDDDAASAPPHV